MLAWLTGAQREDYADESGFPEPPETPGPVFAARAFRSVFFNTPGDEDTPARPTKVTPVPQKAKPLVSPVKPAKATPVPEKPAPFISPVKRSPTKSILLTPGAASRRKNVTFDDPAPKFATGFPQETHAAPKSSGPDDEYWKLEYNKYRVQTEKEMRKLVRYRQIAKSYAKKMDQDNTTLRRQLAEKDAEIVELRRQLATPETKVEGPSSRQVEEKPQESSSRRSEVQQIDEADKMQTRSSQRRRSEDTSRDPRRQSSGDRMKSGPSQSAKPVDAPGTETEALNQPTRSGQRERMESEDRIHVENVGAEGEMPKSMERLLSLRTRRAPSKSPSRDPLNERSNMVNESRSNSLGSYVRARIPADRAAAAAARLKIKTEQRMRERETGKENMSVVT